MESKYKAAVTFIVVLAAFVYPSKVSAASYYVSPSGSDTNSGTSISSMWKTIQYGSQHTPSGSTLYVRGGTYPAGYIRPDQDNVTITNYPGEQFVIEIKDYTEAISCVAPGGSSKRVGVRLIGTDVSEITLSSGIKSHKGIVVINNSGNKAAIPIIPKGGCDNWEIAGIDFIDVGKAIFQRKETNQQNGDYSADGWKVHDNRVYNFMDEVALQFNGDNNEVYNNEVVKLTNSGVSGDNGSLFGCYLMNLNGHGNHVYNNVFTANGSSNNTCSGFIFEWTQSDANIIENNIFSGVKNGIEIQGGDNNIIRNNTISGSGKGVGVSVNSYPDGAKGNTAEWPCGDYPGSSDSYPQPLIPPNNTSHADYKYYYPHECLSTGNQIINNVIKNFSTQVYSNESSTIISGNTASGVTSSTKKGDINNDGKVDVIDVGILIDTYGKGVSTYPKSDVNGDGVININDIGVVIDNYGK